jgi:hypothetical protein
LCVIATSIHSTPRETPADEQTEQADGAQGGENQQNNGQQQGQ